MAEYCEISKEEMESLLFDELDFPRQYNPLPEDKITSGEFVYSKIVKKVKNSKGVSYITLRVYSSIPKNGQSARQNGKDSIKVCLLVKGPDGKVKPFAKTKRVHRVKNWRVNLKLRIQDVSSNIDIQQCDECGSLMVVRESKHKYQFWGCTNYPNCKHTKSFDGEESSDQKSEKPVDLPIKTVVLNRLDELRENCPAEWKNLIDADKDSIMRNLWLYLKEK